MNEKRMEAKASQITRNTAKRPKIKKTKPGTKGRPQEKSKPGTENKKKKIQTRKRGKKIKPSKAETNETITRQFGMTPARTCSQCKCIGKQVSENGKRTWRCPKCQQVVTARPPGLPQDSFIHFQKLVNVLIKRGRDLPLKYFRGTGTTAPKTFYNRIRTDPQVQKIANQVRLHNRLQRCAAQYAYFSIQEYKRRQLTIRELTTYVKGMLTSVEGLEALADEDFPSYRVTKDCQEQIRTFNKRKIFELPDESIYLQNMLRHVRNLLQKHLKTRSPDQDTLAEQQVQGDPVLDPIRLVEGLRDALPELTTTFLRQLSSQLTRRVTQVRKAQGPVFGQGFWDPLIEEILGEALTITTQGHIVLTKNMWDRCRKRWRNTLKTSLLQSLNHILPTLLPVVYRLLDHVTPPTTLINHLFHRSTNRFWYTKDVLTDWTRFLIVHLRETVLTHRLALCRPLFQGSLQEVVKELVHQSKTFLKVPVFTRQSIPLAQDDKYVYELSIENDPLQSHAEDASALRPGELFIRLTLEPRRPRYYHLNTPDRFFELVQAGYQPLQPVLIKRPAGGSLVLAIPFSPLKDSSAPEPLLANEGFADADDISVNVDLGLRTLAAISVTQGVQSVPLDPRFASTEALQAYYTDAHLEDFELARYFLNPDDFPGKANDWHQPAALAPPGRSSAFNFKRRLVHLQEECRQLRQNLDRYRNRTRPNYRCKTKYFQLRREWKRKWQKIRHLHQEMARQVATRIVHLALHHQATLIRFEDLRWAQHRAKGVVGPWLATWQVHWFHGEIIHRTQDLAVRHHIRVELVYAYHTSQRCSSCGAQSKCNGRTFHCPKCHRQLDRDLNAARNIALAPRSPEAIRFGSGPPFPSGNSGGISSEISVAPN
jgi:hypothetical protein